MTFSFISFFFFFLISKHFGFLQINSKILALFFLNISISA